MPWTTDVIETDRLRLRPLEDRDKPTVVALWSSPEVRRFLGGPIDAATIEALATATMGEHPDLFCVAERASDIAIGAVALSRERGEGEVSCEFVSAAWGTGVATEALGALVTWTWRNHGDETLIAVIDRANIGACRLVERLGFEFEQQFEEEGEVQSQYRIRRPT